MTSQTGKQTIAIHILTDIWKTKDNQTTKFDPLIECEKIFFFKNHTENETGRLIPDFFLFLKKASNDVKASGQHLSSNIFW